MRGLFTSGLVLLLSITAIVARAQSVGTLTGTVRDTMVSGPVLPGVTVESPTPR
jgi:hypothetical protein